MHPIKFGIHRPVIRMNGCGSPGAYEVALSQDVGTAGISKREIHSDDVSAVFRATLRKGKSLRDFQAIVIFAREDGLSFVGICLHREASPNFRWAVPDCPDRHCPAAVKKNWLPILGEVQQ